ncbi:MAG TPA: tRNA glutamyl-Q(34) synthetase GluQRS [Thermoanaerobaculia bacterium]
MPTPVGRFAPSPTGPLHMGSLVAAVASWLHVRRSGGRWLVRMEDIDRPRVIPGSAEEILQALRLYGLESDGPVVRQSERTDVYGRTLARLEAQRLVYDCACSRSDLQRVASAPAGRELVYPGTCREGIPDGRPARAVRFKVTEGQVVFQDQIFGTLEEDVSIDTGDFVVRRADGLFAYQLAVVVDDAEQGVTEVVRGADLLPSTGRQIVLQRALGYPTPIYAHVPLVLGGDGQKLGKRDGALPLPTLDQDHVRNTLGTALEILGIRGIDPAPPRQMLATAIERFDLARISREPVIWDSAAARLLK